MKKTTVFLMLGIVMLGLGLVASASAAARLRVNVPFAFYADNQALPAGSYVFEIGYGASASVSASGVIIRSLDGTAASVLLTTPGSGIKMTDNHLHFNKYGEKYFLSKVEGLGYQVNLKANRIEKEMRAQAVPKQETTLIAGK